MDDADHVYHFTCTARLPWIVATKELRPGRNQVGGFPSPDFLWATIRSQGDRTASAMQGYRKRATALVRLTLFAEDFEPWPAITARFPQWTTQQVHRLQAAALRRGEGDVESWRARAEPLPIARVISAEAKTYTGDWQPIKLVSLQHPKEPDMRGILLNGTVYCSIRIMEDGRATQYATTRMSPEDWVKSDVLK